MEQINKVELRGNVGSVRINRSGGKRAIRFSLATNVGYHAADGTPVIETTWHSINAWEGKDMPDFDQIQKGTAVQVWGRIRNSRYTAQDGSEKDSSEIIANRIKIVEENLTAQM